MHWVYDFDSTLYATERLWKQWEGVLLKYGFTQEQIEETGHTFSFPTKTYFTPERHATLLGLVGDDFAAVVAQHKRDIASGKDLLYTDTMPFIEARPDHLHSLLTFGDEDHQMEKIHATGLHEHMKDIRIASAEKGKDQHLKELIEASQVPMVFIDDRIGQLELAHKAELPIRLIRMKRPGESYGDETHALDNVAWEVIESLEDLDD